MRLSSRVQIVERPAKHSIGTERLKSGPEVIGIAEAAECADASTGERGHGFADTIGAPRARNEAGAKSGRDRVEIAQAFTNEIKTKIVFRARHDERVGTRQRGERFARRPRGIRSS